MQEFCLLYRIAHFLLILTGSNKCRKPITKQTLIIHCAFVYYLRLKAFFSFLTKGQLIRKDLLISSIVPKNEQKISAPVD